MAAVPTAHDINVKPRTGDVLIEENLDFRGLLLSESIQQGLEKGGFQRPSPIQLKAIPLGRCGLDLIVQAKSGTGKTCVFSVIALDGVILDSLATQVLVLAPTREIAVQICDVINSIGSCMKGLQCLTFIGGTPLSVDRQKLARCHIAVGTPGRIKQLIEEKILPTSNIRLFVLDEADKLLEDSFQEQINWIFSSLPDNKQMLALSATYPEVLAQHLTAYMRNPTFLRLNVTDPALLGIRQYYKQVEFHPLANKLFDRKTDALLELLSTVEFHQCLVFSNFQMRAESLSEVLNFRGWPATYISGSREQQDRMAAMASLKQMTCRVLISTDLTSRGIDAENVNLIINLDLPPNHETYLHRIGRAGRFGTYGAGVSFVADGKEMEELKRLEKACNTTVKPLPDPIPTDLARSSGFMSLEHLVTTETIITQKEGVDIKSSKVPMPQLVKKDAKPQDAGSPAKPVVTSSDNGQLRSKPDDAKSNGTKSKAEPQQLNGSNGKVVDGSEKNKDTSEIPTVAVPTDTRLPPTDAAQTGAKPKWKTNNVWTNLSFSYGAECQQMDDQRKKGKLTHAGPGDQRRNEGPKKDSAHSPKKCVAKENGVRNGVENSITAVKESGENKFVQKSRKEPTLTMPSLKDIRGSPCQLRPFSEIMEDFANFTVKGESIPEKKEDQQETTKCFALSMQYLENVSRLLKELSEKEKALQKSPCPAMPATNPLPTPGMSTTQQGEPCKKVQSEKHVQLQSAKTVKVQSEPQAVPCKMEPKYEPKPSCRTENVSCTGETGTETTIEKEAPNKPGVEKVSAENMAGARKETTHKSWDRSGTRGKQKSPVTLSVGSTMERLMTNYETLNESNKDQASGVHQTNTTSPQAIHPNKPKPSKSKKRVDPYGAWELYVAPEPPTPVAEQYKSPEITDDEDSDGTPEDLESDWESSSISCEEEDVYDGAHAGRNRRRSSAKPTQMGYEHTPSPCFTSPADYVAYQNAWMAQQAVFYTSACYQQYMLHLQYAEYYRQQLKAQQHAACDMDSLYASHKKYIRKMAKWLAKHNPDE